MEFLIANPGVSWLIGAGGLATYLDLRRQKNKEASVVLLAAVLWGCYGCWEWIVGSEANIRVDLVLIYPVLAIVSAIAVGVAVRASEKAQSKEPEGK